MLQWPRTAAASSARGGLVGVEAGDGVDRLASFASAGWPAASVDAEREAGVREGDSAEFVGDAAGLDGAGFVAAVSGGGGGVLDGDVVPGQGGKLPVGGRLVTLDHGDVVGVLGLDQPGGVRLDRVQGVEGDESSVHVQRFEQGPEVRGLVRLLPDLRLGEGQGPVVGDGGEQVPAAGGVADRS